MFNSPIPRFAPAIEREFQTAYYVRIRPTLRLVSGVLAATLALYLLIGQNQFAAFIGVFSVPYIGFCALLFGLTFAPNFGRVWQSATVAAAWLGSAAALFWLGHRLAQFAPPDADPFTFGVITHLLFTLQVSVTMVTLAALRLQFRAALLLQTGVVAAGVAVVIGVLPLDASVGNGVIRFLEPVFLVWLSVALAAFLSEQLARRAFEANRELMHLQAQEQQKRVETEKMLHVLNGAIGGIVHDLGNPLTSVQGGSELLKQVLGDDKPDGAMLLELNEMVLRGAKMLNFLRLSLIEQSRVLEGQPVPVETKSIGVRGLVEAGVSFQKARFSTGHELILEDGDAQICADEMKMITVFMNLLGNALKYSDGQVRVSWRAHDDLLLLAIADQGKSGQGLTSEQAQQLFVPFGRLNSHADIEGTGLGLLSVQKIVQAHGGEVWIEGFADGTPDSPRFSTAHNETPALLAEPFRTAFVLSCPLASGALAMRADAN